MSQIIYYESNCTNPYYNLALEEYLFRHKKEHTMTLCMWQNDKTIVIGRYQDLLEEVNMKFATEEDICIVRRNSGGGAVYHDLGNLNYTIIFDKKENENLDIAKFMQPLLEAVLELGIPAEISGRNDIKVKDYKISGNSVYVADGKILLHGTVLIHSNLKVLKQALTRRSKLIDSKATSSIKSNVENLQTFYEKEIELSYFQTILKNKFFQGNRIQYGILSDEEINAIKKIEQEKYMTNEWNYGKSPECDVIYEGRYEGGIVRAHLKMEGCVVKRIWFDGDFICKKEIEELEKEFLGMTIDKSLLNKLEAVHIEDYFVKINTKDIYHLLFKYSENECTTSDGVLHTSCLPVK